MNKDKDKNSHKTRFLTFKIGTEIFAIKIESIQEIFIYPDMITELPNTTSVVKGVINLRGEVTPIIDLRMHFNINKNPTYDDRTIVISINTSDNRMIGLVVDRINNIENINLSNLSRSPDIGTSISSDYIQGLFKNDEGFMIAIMDIDKILSKDEVSKL
jgi:purine-binding chemotaxis protein CheW